MTQSKKKPTLQQCLAGQEWYRCPLPMTIFIVFLILFIYSIGILIKCSNLIREHSNEGDAAFEAKYGKKINAFTQVYVINMIVMILSLIVLVFFLHKAIPVSRQALFFNEYLGALIVLYMFIVSAWTLSVFNSVKGQEEGATTGFTAVILVVSMAGLAVYGYQIYQYVQAYPSQGAPNVPPKQQQQMFYDARSS